MSESGALRPLRSARWPEVERSPRRLLIVPVGSLEQHGPHLPMDTDARIAAAVATAVHQRLPGTGLAPVISIGASGEHADFPGTLSIGTEALRSMLVELVRHAGRFWAHTLFLNGHGGNAGALGQAAELCAYEGRPVTVHHAGARYGDAHAGHTETCVMLHLAAAEVRLELAEPGNTRPIGELLPRLRTEGVRALSANGVLGDPTGATAAEGSRIYARLVQDALKIAAPLAY